MRTSFRRFRLVREVDVSGVSGTGPVAEGVQWSSGRAALNWLSEVPSSGVYESLEDVLTVHGHQGTTRLEWVDPPDGNSPAAPLSGPLRARV